MRNSIVPFVESAPPRRNAAEGLGLARFMELRGHRVVERFGALWHSVGHGMYISFPYHRRLDLDPREAACDLRAMGALGIRYPSLTRAGLPSGLYVCRTRGYEIANLHRNFRSHLRHGLPCCEIRRLNEREMVEDAYAINRAGMLRQGRFDREFGDKAQWRRFANAVQNSPCITPLGAFVDGRLACYGITCLEDGWLHILYKMTDFNLDEHHPSQVLDFTVTRDALKDPAVVAASMGWSPLIELPGLHEYKIRLGYDCEPQYSVVQLRPAIHRILTGRIGRTAVSALRRAYPGPSQNVRMALAVCEAARLSSEIMRN